VQATAAGLAVALGGIGRDVVDALARGGYLGAERVGPAVGYVTVYTVEIVLLLLTIGVMGRLVRAAPVIAVVRPTQTAA
jgi:MFS transporter, BCD family, chlorophyll transporter